eukprot:jgi/Phyca11/535610/estExt2_fgenesh1_pg.C_PHYCAscaffold_390007
MSSRHGTSDYSDYYGSAPAGLVVTAPNGREKLVMSDQEICDDIVSTVPKLRTAVARDTYGRRWKQGHRRHGVDLFELAKSTGEETVDEDRDIAYAVVAKAELRCHLNEVLNVLITHESNVYESTMKALAGKKFKKGEVLFSQRRLLSQDLRRQSMVASRLEMEEEEAPEQALIGVNVATLRPRMPMDLGGNKKTQKLCFSTFTQQYPVPPSIRTGDLVEALGPAVVAVDDALWYNDDQFHVDVDGDTASMTSDSSSVEELTDQLYSNDPSQHSHALDFLGQLVNPATTTYEYEFMPCVKDLGVKFYAGFPVHGPNGEVVASLCAADAVPHNNISTKDYATMQALAKLASDLVTPKNAAIC